MRIDFNNNPTQVIYLQSFLKYFEGYDYVQVNGVFDDLTFRAVSAFQEKYRDDVLEPWAKGQTPTGYVYILTLRKINEIVCGPQTPISVPQAQEIENYVPTPGVTPEVGMIEPITAPVEGPPKGQNLAAALFAFPDTFADGIRCLYTFILILIVLYILGNVLRDVLYENTLENVRKRFLTKWITIISGLIIAIIVAYIFGRWCIILPLLVALVLSIIWTSLYPKHNSIRVSTKAWYLVITARTKTFLNS
ncbi:MAG: peptidoglycan-binding domain-containing protein [Patescibacteria group bacterium]